MKIKPKSLFKISFLIHIKMSLYDCNSCSACGGNCDRCTATVCLNNMESHKEIPWWNMDLDEEHR